MSDERATALTNAMARLFMEPAENWEVDGEEVLRYLGEAGFDVVKVDARYARFVQHNNGPVVECDPLTGLPAEDPT